MKADELKDSRGSQGGQIDIDTINKQNGIRQEKRNRLGSNCRSGLDGALAGRYSLLVEATREVGVWQMPTTCACRVLGALWAC